MRSIWCPPSPTIGTRFVARESNARTSLRVIATEFWKACLPLKTAPGLCVFVVGVESNFESGYYRSSAHVRQTPLLGCSVFFNAWLLSPTSATLWERETRSICGSRRLSIRV